MWWIPFVALALAGFFWFGCREVARMDERRALMTPEEEADEVSREAW